jgi:hypothetical protein
VGGFLLGRGGEGVDVVEDVGGLVDGEGGAHFGEHVVLGFAFEEVLLVWIGKFWGSRYFFSFLFFLGTGEMVCMCYPWVGRVVLVMNGEVIFV